MTTSGPGPRDLAIVPVADGDWPVVAWLWQAYRQDLAPIVDGLPYADGRYQHGDLDAYPSPDGAGYLAWRPHPRTGDRAPLGFALVDGLRGDRRSVAGFWVAPAARQDGIGMALARHAIGAHPGPWSIAFQHDNAAAGAFWRRVADAVFGAGAWTETERPVARAPWAPPDHWIETQP